MTDQDRSSLDDRIGKDPFDRDLGQQLATTAKRITETTGVDRAEADALVEESAAAYEDSKVERFIPTLVERDVRGRLRDRA